MTKISKWTVVITMALTAAACAKTDEAARKADSANLSTAQMQEQEAPVSDELGSGKVTYDKFRAITPEYLVSAQITPLEVAIAKRMGVTMIINNRPDGEARGQTASAEIAAAAEAAGIKYIEIFVENSSSINAGHLDAFDKAIAENDDGKSLAFCRSGNRSTLVRSYAAARSGRDIDTIIKETAAAGRDISARETILEEYALEAGHEID